VGGTEGQVEKNEDRQDNKRDGNEIREKGGKKIKVQKGYNYRRKGVR
jgi:hypothetical protein